MSPLSEDVQDPIGWRPKIGIAITLHSKSKVLLVVIIGVKMQLKDKNVLDTRICFVFVERRDAVEVAIKLIIIFLTCALK